VRTGSKRRGASRFAVGPKRKEKSEWFGEPYYRSHARGVRNACLDGRTLGKDLLRGTERQDAGLLCRAVETEWDDDDHDRHRLLLIDGQSSGGDQSRYELQGAGEGNEDQGACHAEASDPGKNLTVARETEKSRRQSSTNGGWRKISASLPSIASARYIHEARAICGPAPFV
jgi:hypothetical protein